MQDARPTIDPIAPEALKSKLANGGLDLVAITSADDHARLRIAGSHQLPPGADVARGIESLVPDRERPIALYGDDEPEIDTAARKLADLGYLNVYRYQGPTPWKQAGFTLEGSAAPGRTDARVSTPMGH